MAPSAFPRVRRQRISPPAAATLGEGSLPTELEFAADYPAEFAAGDVAEVGEEAALGPFSVADKNGLIIGEIGGSFTAPQTIEVGYAIVGARHGRGQATEALEQFVPAARGTDATRVVAQTLVERPHSGRVVSRAGFRPAGMLEERHEGQVLQAERRELDLGSEDR